MAWPDTTRPGEPAETARPWHWVSRHGDAGPPQPVSWNPALRRWTLWDGVTLTPQQAQGALRYHGPALTPEETKAVEAEAGPPRGLAGLAASALPEPPPRMVYRAAAVRNHLLIFAGTLFGTLFIIDKFNIMK